MNTDNETKKFDCSRGCTVEREDDGALNCTYRQGCCKLEVYDWLQGVRQEQCKDYFEVRFKNTRKGIYVNKSGQTVKTGDMVIVEAANGHDLGIVTLEGPIVMRQMACKKLDPATTDFKRIYRKAKIFDLEKWQEAIAREHETMIRARQIAEELGLEMKIGDVEFQGDGTKAIFYYIADGRVDFRQLIKVFAEEFRIRIEMKQIGARQEAGLIGGLGVCGRELCCSNYISAFQSISTVAARCQDLSLNPQKLAGQCGKLKCCLNYETASYIDAQSRIPKISSPLEFEDGLAYLMKTDILRETMFFSYDPNSLSNLFALPASEVKEIIRLNREGIKPESLKVESDMAAPEFVSAVGDDSITRFDESRRKKKKSKTSGKGGHKQEKNSQKPEKQQGQPKSDKQSAYPKPERQSSQSRQERQSSQNQDTKPVERHERKGQRPEHREADTNEGASREGTSREGNAGRDGVAREGGPRKGGGRGHRHPRREQQK